MTKKDPIGFYVKVITVWDYSSLHLCEVTMIHRKPYAMNTDVDDIYQNKKWTRNGFLGDYVLRSKVNLLNKLKCDLVNPKLDNRDTIFWLQGEWDVPTSHDQRSGDEKRSIEAVFQASAPAVARCSCSSLLQLRVSPAPVQEVGGEKAGSPYLASSAAVHLGQRDMLSGPVTPGRLQHQWVGGGGIWIMVREHRSRLDQWLGLHSWLFHLECEKSRNALLCCTSIQTITTVTRLP